MEYSVNMRKDANTYIGKSNINWNKGDINSNFQVNGQASFINTKNLHNQVELELVHATRTVSLEAVLHKTLSTMRSKGVFMWDKDNSKKAGFDLHQVDKKYSAKMITPSRSIALINEYDDRTPVVWSEHTLHWDAASDTDKKAGIRLTRSGKRNINHQIDIKLPTFNKVIFYP